MGYVMKILLVIVLHIRASNSHSDGAPDLACSNLDPSPGHGPSSNSGPAPYKVTLSSATYTPGQTITVTLSGENGAPFKGFLIEAFPVEGQAEKAVGTFDVPDGANYKPVCQSTTGNGLTHTDPSLKSSLTFSWTAPAQPVGDLVFHFSVMRGKNPPGLGDYFKDLKSMVLTMNAAPATGFKKDPECGTSKGCYSSCGPADTCDWLMSWKAEGDDHVRISLLSMFTSDEHYVALGFSERSAMFNASVVACRIHKDKVSVIASFNPGYKNTPLQNPTEGISDLDGSFTDGVLNCTFLRVKTSGNKYVFNLTDPWYLITARGDLNKDGNIQQHDYQSRFYTKNKINFMESNADLTFTDGTFTTALTTHSTPSHATGFKKDPECGTSKGCYSSCGPADTCDWLMSWKAEGEDHVRISLLSTFTSDEHYVALGFSERSAMFNASVVACRIHKDKVSVIASFNPGYKNTPLQNPTEGISDLDGSFTDGVLNCTFLRVKTSGNKYVFNLTDPWYLITARGDLDKDGILQQHDFQSRFHTTQKINFAESHADLSFSDGTFTTTPNTPTGTTPPHSGSFKKDPACGVSKGCFSNCDDGVCNFLTSWKPKGKDYEITLTSAFDAGDSRYVAFGFSDAEKMYPASVIECVAYNGHITDSMSYNAGYSNQRVSFKQKVLTLVGGSFKDGILNCTLLRQTKANNSKIFDLTKKWYLIVARGQVSGGDMTPHDVNNRFLTKHRVLLSDTSVDISMEEETYTLIKLHGSLMIAAWILSASIGVAMARFFKPIWPDTKICGVKVWFAIHRGSMLLTFALGVAGFVVIFIEIDGYSDIIGENYKKAHPILGIIVTGLLVINPFMSLLRCGPDHPHRPIFNWAHYLVGTSAHILSAVTIAIGMYLPKARVDGETALIVIIIYASWQVLFFCIMTGLDFVASNQSKVKVFHQHKGSETIPVKQSLPGVHVTKEYKTLNESTVFSMKDDPKGSKIPTTKKWVMLFHVAILVAVAGYLMYMVIDADD